MKPGASSNRRIIMQRPDGSVSVVILTNRGAARLDADPAFRAKHRAEIETRGRTVVKEDATTADLPTETVDPKRFRNAWRWVGSAIVHDIPACREQIMAEVRAERDAKLAKTDGEATRSMERGQPDAGLASYRQALRDLPAAVEAEIENITTAAELEAYTASWPTRS